MQLVPLLLGCLSMLSNNVLNKEIIYNLLLVISGILVEKNGERGFKLCFSLLYSIFILTKTSVTQYDLNWKHVSLKLVGELYL